MRSLKHATNNTRLETQEEELTRTGAEDLLGTQTQHLAVQYKCALGNVLSRTRPDRKRILQKMRQSQWNCCNQWENGVPPSNKALSGSAAALSTVLTGALATAPQNPTSRQEGYKEASRRRGD